MAILQSRPKTALLVVDMQNGVVENACNLDLVVANIGHPGAMVLSALAPEF
jgi:hypothetical protein